MVMIARSRTIAFGTQRKFVLTLFLTLVCLHVKAQEAPYPRPRQKVSVPAMATRAGARVGLDTMEGLEQRIGVGYVTMGGHSHGAREWVSRQMGGCFLFADSFNYNRQGGRVIHHITVGKTVIEKGDAKVPVFTLPRASLRFLGKVALGMNLQQVKQALKDRLPPPEEQGNALLWKAKGFAPLSFNHVDDIHQWEAKLSFSGDTLTEIVVSCDTP